MENKTNHLAFKITNELLNQGYIIDDAQLTTIEATITTILKTHLGTDITGERKIHFECFEGELLCHQWRVCEPRLTTDETMVTCQRCLKSLARGRRDWYIQINSSRRRIERNK